MNMKKLTTKKLSDNLGIPQHTIRQAARRYNLGSDKYGKILYTEDEALSLIFLLHLPVDAIKDTKTREIIRRALYNYCNT